MKIEMNVEDYSEIIDLAMISTLIKRNKEIKEEMEELWDLETRETEDEPE